jgi:cytochrome c biogenesis protein CcdA
MLKKIIDIICWIIIIAVLAIIVLSGAAPKFLVITAVFCILSIPGVYLLRFMGKVDDYYEQNKSKKRHVIYVYIGLVAGFLLGLVFLVYFHYEIPSKINNNEGKILLAFGFSGCALGHLFSKIIKENLRDRYRVTKLK